MVGPATILYGRDASELLAPSGPRTQAMPGYDACYSDIVDYILRCTHRIWEGKDLGLIRTHYADDCAIRTGWGETRGAAAVIAGTARTLAAFPDRTLVGDAVIWKPEGDGFYTSHRIVSTATNLGPSEFGPATGRRATFLTVADCVSRANRITEEWLARDNSALLVALGLPLRETARRMAGAVAAGRRADVVRLSRALRAEAPAPRDDAPLPDARDDPEGFARAVIETLMDAGHLHRVRDAYSPAAHWNGPGGRRLFGWGETAGWFAALLGTFGDGRVRVERMASNARPDGGADVAIGWTFAATHDGPALYGPPTGRDVLLPGATHLRLEEGVIAEEWTVFDEVALLAQLEFPA